MNTITEFFEVLRMRVKAPIFGYFTFAFLAVNWKELFFLFFSDTTVLEKVEYFEDGTTYWSLLLIPILIALSITVIQPWITLLLLKICTLPTELKNQIQASTEHKMLVEKQKHEEARRKLKDTWEKQLIDEAKIDEEIDEIPDREKRDQVRSEVDKLRKDFSKVDELEKFPVEQVKFSQILNLPLTKENLRIYSLKKFPELEPSTRIELLILNDIDKERYQFIRDIHDAVERAEEFLVKYKKKQPGYFGYSTDYISKALGFVDKEFRNRHKFAVTTRNAIEDFQNESRDQE